MPKLSEARIENNLHFGNTPCRSKKALLNTRIVRMVNEDLSKSCSDSLKVEAERPIGPHYSSTEDGSE